MRSRRKPDQRVVAGDDHRGLEVLADSADAVFIAIAARKALPDSAAALSTGFATLSAALGLVTLYQYHRVGSRCRTTAEDIW
jgi:hypothetical protein